MNVIMCRRCGREFDPGRPLAAGLTLSLGQAKRLYRRSLVSDMTTSFAEESAALTEGRRPKFTGH